METKTILNVNIIDVREVEGRKSNNMERVGFERGMDKLLESNMGLKEVVTDAHSEMGTLTSKLAKMQMAIKIITKYMVQYLLFKLNPNYINRRFT